MDEYISKKDILQMIESTAMWNRSFSVLYEDIEGMKPSDVAHVRHGRWLLDGSCSECLANPLTTHKKYCPNCGAKMDLEVTADA